MVQLPAPGESDWADTVLERSLVWTPEEAFHSGSTTAVPLLPSSPLQFAACPVETAITARSGIFLGLQVFQVLFLWLHDWVPLSGLNDVAAARSQDTTARLIVVTLIQSVPFTVGLLFSILQIGRPYPHWLYMWLWISYSLIFVGQRRAWWIPYLFHPEPERAARYQIMFGKTHSFLPSRNGLVPNTAHIALHIATAATLLALLVN